MSDMQQSFINHARRQRQSIVLRSQGHTAYSLMSTRYLRAQHNYNHQYKIVTILNYTPYSHWNRWVLRADLKEPRDLEQRRDFGSAFQSTGAALQKARSPPLFKTVHGSTNLIPSLADLSDLDGW